MAEVRVSDLEAAATLAGTELIPVVQGGDSRKATLDQLAELAPAGADGDPGVGVPAGGAEGQTLVKASAADHDTEWATPSGGGGGGSGALFPSSGNPNGDPTVPSPPPDVRSLAYDRATLDLYKWDTAADLTFVDTFDGDVTDPAPNGATWNADGTWSMAFGVLSAAGPSTFDAFTADWGTGDVDISATLDGSTDNFGIVARWTNSANWVYLVADNSACYFSVHVAGGDTNFRVFGGGGGGAGVVLRLVCVGNSYSMYRNGVLLGTQTDTASAFLNVPNHGLITNAGITVGYQSLEVTVANPAGMAWVPVGSGLGTGGGGGGAANPWGLFGATGTSLTEEFDGTSELTWTPLAPAGGSGGHVTWTVGNDVMSAVFGGQWGNRVTTNLTPHPMEVGDHIEVAYRLGGAQMVNFAGLIVTDGTADSSNLLVAGQYFDGSYHVLCRDGTIAAVTSGVNIFHGSVPMFPFRTRLTRVTSSTWQFETSVDGVSWIPEGAAAFTWDHTPSHVGVAVSGWGNDNSYGDVCAAFDYLRVY